MHPIYPGRLISMTIIEVPTGTLPALGPRRLGSIVSNRHYCPRADHDMPPEVRVARHIGRELQSIRHDPARLAEAISHLCRLSP